MDNVHVGRMFPPDAIARAKAYLAMTNGGGVGAYSDSRGLPGVRKEVAQWIEQRDGYPSDPEHIFLTDGASKGVTSLMQALIRSPKDGILCPIPQYPLYSATIALLGGTLVPYYLSEEKNWSLDLADLQASLIKARRDGLEVRGMVFINPGNPTGQCLSVGNLRDLIAFCHRERIVLLADEVYQENVYQDERPFVSAKKVMMDMGPPYSNSVELVSFHTVSKGSYGECGQRGGYFEMTNIHPQAMDELYKVASISLSPNVNGQIVVHPPSIASLPLHHQMGLMMNPPKPGDHSHAQYVAERKAIMESLRTRAHMMTDGFNSCKNVTCNFTEGAMYSFPRIELPRRAVEAARSAGKAPDTFYCLRLLEATGISTVPGSGFGQKEGSFHLRTTILPKEEKMPAVMDAFKKFNDGFMDKYSGGPQSRL
eukprot:jgi/Mesen1/9414/ME000614S08666